MADESTNTVRLRRWIPTPRWLTATWIVGRIRSSDHCPTVPAVLNADEINFFGETKCH